MQGRQVGAGFVLAQEAHGEVGDEFLPNANIVATRAVETGAPSAIAPRNRLAAWDADWRATGPQWTHRR
ncbi:MAG TPA: hypothetical protein VIV12_02855 [Streptosporangiaceae bacterium]